MKKNGSTLPGTTPCEDCGALSVGRDKQGRCLCGQCLSLEKSGSVRDARPESLRNAGEDMTDRHRG